LAKITPVRPPIVKSNINPKVKYKGVTRWSAPPQRVANQLNTFIPVGIAITIVAAVK
jgi:hypothetical protein